MLDQRAEAREVAVDARGRHTVALADFPRPVLPSRISRASLAALMLDEAESNSHAGRLVVPLS